MNFMLLVARAILFLPLEHKIHIFSPPCNILYVLHVINAMRDTDYHKIDLKAL